MNNDVEEALKSILTRLESIEQILVVDQATDTGKGRPIQSRKMKTVTLAELARTRQAINGQQKVAIIVGYYEKITGKESVTRNEIKDGWKDGKFLGSFADMLVHRAIKDGLLRDLKGGYDLSQTGENFFDSFIASPKEDKAQE